MAWLPHRREEASPWRRIACARNPVRAFRPVGVETRTSDSDHSRWRGSVAKASLAARSAVRLAAQPISASIAGGGVPCPARERKSRRPVSLAGFYPPATGRPGHGRRKPFASENAMMIKTEGASRPISRRVVLAGGSAVALVSTPAVLHAASPAWAATTWLARWHRLGCGAHVTQSGQMQLTAREGVEAKAGALLAELTAGRAGAVKTVLMSADRTCAAQSALDRLHAIEAQFVSDDDDPEGHEAWQERWFAAISDLARSPARSGSGLAGKIIEGIEYQGTPHGDPVLRSALAQLERWS